MDNVSFLNNIFYIGIDAHFKNWKVTIRNSGIELKTFCMNPSSKELFFYPDKHYLGASFYIVCETGFCCFWPQK